MSTESNKALVVEWMSALVHGDVAKARGFYAEDCRFLVVGDMPYAGWMDLTAFFGQTKILALDGPHTIEIGDMTAEGDKVWFEAQSFGTLQSGGPYENWYVFFVRLRDGKIVEYKEFLDTLYVNRVIDHPLTRGPVKPRYRIFQTPAVTIEGEGPGKAMRAAEAG